MRSWEQYWNNFFDENQNKVEQVQRTSNGLALTEAQLSDFSDFVLFHTGQQTGQAMSSEQHYLDVCCGNGIMTLRIAPNYETCTGIDFSEPLIQQAIKTAKACENNAVTFIVENAMNADRVFNNKADLITLFFSLQYFELQEGRRLLQKLYFLLKPGGKLYIGDIPNFYKTHNLYGKGLHWMKFKIKQWLGLEQTGRFWKPEELDRICSELGTTGIKIEQPRNLPYSHYRFDYLITKI